MMVESMPHRPTFAWLEITGLCNEFCTDCYADSGPQGSHGNMTLDDWFRVIHQCKQMGVRHLQFIGGEPTLHKGLGDMIRYARRTGAQGIEVFSNMTYIPDALWETFVENRVNLATSYYSDVAEEHDSVTNTRGSHKRTRQNIAKALELGLEVRGGVIDVRAGQRVAQAQSDLVDLGVPKVGLDASRPFGRGARGVFPKVENLCGACGDGKFAVSPNGEVWPCVFARWMPVGNVQVSSLQDIWGGSAMGAARGAIADVHGQRSGACGPGVVCLPQCSPAGGALTVSDPCVPDAEAGLSAESVRYFDQAAARTKC